MTCSCLRGVSRWFTPLACGPGSPELSKSYMDMASKLFTLHYITCPLSQVCTLRMPVHGSSLTEPMCRSLLAHRVA